MTVVQDSDGILRQWDSSAQSFSRLPSPTLPLLPHHAVPSTQLRTPAKLRQAQSGEGQGLTTSAFLPLSGSTGSTLPLAYPPRPEPLTPHKMRYRSTPPADASLIAAQSRRTSVSAIPRPTSGTSRQATPTGALFLKSDAGVHQSGSKQNHKLRNSWHPNEGMPPTSFNFQYKSSLYTDATLSEEQQHHCDLPGTQQHPEVTSFSSHLVLGEGAYPSPSKIRRENSLDTTPKRVTATKTGSTSREVTPRRGLLQPIGPPLPRSQTLGNISCFKAPNATPSPEKPAAHWYRGELVFPRCTQKLSSAEALVESRMTKDEIGVMIQAEKPAIATQPKHQFNSIASHCPIPSLSQPNASSAHSGVQDSSSATIRLSINDVVNTQRLENLRQQTPSRRLMFINSGLANEYHGGDALSTSHTSSTIESSNADEDLDDPRVVRTFQHYNWWAGRYSTVCDRLRTQDHLSNQSNSISCSTNQKKEDALYEASESRRMNAALDQLRSFCKTADALKGFDEFEARLLKSLGGSRRSMPRSSSIDFKIREFVAKARTELGLPISARDASEPNNKNPSISAESNFGTGPKHTFSQGLLTRSKTTANLTTIAPGISRRKSGTAKEQSRESVPVLPTSYPTKSSVKGHSQDMKEKAVEERKERAVRRAANVHRRTSSYFSTRRMVNMDTPKTTFPVREVVTEPREQPEDKRYGPDVTIKLREFDQVVDGLDCAMLESGHGVPPPITIVSSPSKVVTTTAPGGGIEKLIKSRRKSDRQTSGELVKSFFGAGVREVKKMGRRVSGGVDRSASSENLLGTSTK